MMIALVGCTKRKKDHACKAIELYSESCLFSKEIQYAENIHVDDIFILSAKHHLINRNEIIEPYNETLYDMKIKKRKEWAKISLEQIKERIPVDSKILLLCGKKYYENLEKMLESEGYDFIIPLKGLGGIGKQLVWLNDQISKDEP